MNPMHILHFKILVFIYSKEKQVLFYIETKQDQLKTSGCSIKNLNRREDICNTCVNIMP